jgi:O-antigen ligase
MINKALTYSFLSFGLIPILPTRILGLPVVLMVLAVLFSLISNKVGLVRWKTLLLIISPYLMFFLSVFYSENIGEAARKVLETRLSLLIVPLTFSVLKDKQLKLLEENKWLMKKIFVTSTFIFCFLYFISLFFIAEAENPIFRFPSGFFFKSALSKIPFIKFEPVFISFIIVIAVIFLSELFSQKKMKRLYIFLFLSFYITVLLLMVSKLAIIFLSIFFVWFLFNQIKEQQIRIYVFLGLIFCSFFVAQIPSINYEIKEVQYFFKGKKLAADDSTDVRKKISISSFELAKTANPLFGVGIGDIQKKLNEVYEKKGYTELLEKKFDPHNQFLSMYISTGIIGLFSLFLVLIFCLRLCVKNKAWYQMWCVIFLFSQMLTESMLERQLTVIVFSIIISTIVFIPNEKKKLLL